MKFSLMRLRFLAIIFFVMMYALFFIYKITMYSLFYYQHDMFSVISSGCGWIYGHPLWWDNRYGVTPAIHFSFIAPLLSPFIILMGGKGLFLVHALIYFMAFYWALQGSSDQNILKKRIAVVFVFFISPYALWLFDDPFFGWHIELLFLPFSVFFVLALISKKSWLAVVCALPLVFTKEDGCVIACCIHLLYALSENTQQQIKWKQLFKITSAWLVVFIICLFIIKFFNDFKPTRVETTFNEFYHDESLFNAAYFRKIIWQILVMLLPLFLISFFILNNNNFFKLILFIIPVLIIGIISGLWYSGNAYFSVSWVPRFVEIMGLMLAGIFIFLNKQLYIESFKKKIPTQILVITVIMLQVISLNMARDYKLLTEIRKAYANTLYSTVTPADAGIIRCIAARTPNHFNVAVPFEYFSLFDKNDLTWFDHPENAPQKNPDLVILEDTSKFGEYKFDYGDYQSEKKGKFYILVKKDRLLLDNHCN
ncbi:MAG: hypothetical protein ABIT08_09860 [Bacteroidia bacterium]